MPHRVTEINNVLAVTETELGKCTIIINLNTYADYNSVLDHIAHMSKLERSYFHLMHVTILTPRQSTAEKVVLCTYLSPKYQGFRPVDV